MPGPGRRVIDGEPGTGNDPYLVAWKWLGLSAPSFPSCRVRNNSESLDMSYTLWSRNRLLGETDFDFIYREEGHRCGWFHPSERGERLMPAATGVAPAMRTEYTIGPDATLHADVLAASDAEEALELEVRGPDGKRIETESIYIVDTHYLLSIPNNDLIDEDEMYKLTPEQEAEVDEWVAEWREAHAGEEWRDDDDEEVEFPRYQIQIRLVDHYEIP